MKVHVFRIDGQLREEMAYRMDASFVGNEADDAPVITVFIQPIYVDGKLIIVYSTEVAYRW